MTRKLAVVVLLAALTACAPPKATRPTRLPDATLPGLPGTPATNLHSIKGPALVNVWAWWCAPCQDELPIYAAFAKKHPEIRVVGVDYLETRPAEAVKLMRRSGVTYPNVRDDEPVLHSQTLPRLLLIDPKGRIVHDQSIEIKSLAQLEKIVEEGQ